MAYLIDSDILIFSMRDDPLVRKHFSRFEGEPKNISIVSYGELLFGAKKSANPEKNLAQVVRIKSLFPIIPIDIPIMETFSELKVKYQRQGIVIADFDLLIASTALARNETMVTHNTKHFTKITELKVEDWRIED